MWLHSAAELAGLKGPSWYHLRVLQLALAVGLGHFGIPPHGFFSFPGLDRLPHPVAISAYQEGKGQSCKASQSLGSEAGPISLLPFLLVKASHKVIPDSRDNG